MKLTEMLQRTELENLVSYLIYDASANEELINNCEDRIKQSFRTFFDELKRLHPDTDKEDDDLYGIVADLVSVHDDTFFTAGVLVGFQLYKNMEQGYEFCKDGDIRDVLQKAEVSKSN